MEKITGELEKDLGFLIGHTGVDAKIKFVTSLGAHFRVRIELPDGTHKSLVVIDEPTSVRIIESTAGQEKLASFYIPKKTDSKENHLQLVSFLYGYVVRARMEYTLGIANRLSPFYYDTAYATRSN